MNDILDYFREEVASAPKVAVTLGGPRDGAEMVIPDLRGGVLLFPTAPLPVIGWTAEDALYPVEPIRHLRYELARCLGWPSLDDRGRYRYEYVGVR